MIFYFETCDNDFFTNGSANAKAKDWESKERDVQELQ